MNIIPSSEWRPGVTGIYSDIPSEQYHCEASGLSRSMAVDMVFRSPAHMRYSVDHPEPPTKFMDIGTVVHCACLEPEKLLNAYYVRPEQYPSEKEGMKPWNGNSNWCKDWLKSHSGRPVLTLDQIKTVEGCVAALRSNAMLSSMFIVGVAELSCFELSRDTLLRCRPDMLASDDIGRIWCIDLKKCQDASEPAFRSHARAMRYDFQQAWYERVLKLCGIDVHSFVFAAVEEKPPHGVGVYQLDPENVNKQITNVHLAIDRYQQCRELNEWPSYDGGIKTIRLKVWE